MKRKIFSKLLMGALLVASVSSFVSCKDYDDDINNLQDQINAKAALSELSALQSTLDSKIAAAQSAAQAAQATADKAATATSVAELQAALEKAIAAAKQAGTDAGTEAGKAIAAANKAQATADGAQSAADAAKTAADAAAAAAKKADEDAKAALAKALEDIKAAYATKAEAAAAATAAATAQSTADAAKTAAEAAQKAADAAAKAAQETADAAYTKAEAEELKAEVKALKEKIESGAADEALQEAIQEAKNAAASVEAIWSAVTGIEFVVDQWGVIVNPDILNFQWGKQVDNVFGNGKELHAYDATDKPETYKAGDDIKAENIYFVRVNPVNAELDAANLKLINSLGENLDEFVDIKAEPFKELLTRAGETGLWKVTVTLKEGADREKLQKAATVKLSRDKKRTVSSAVYALAVNNTEDAADDRFAVTTYDLQVWTNDYTPATDLNFTVNTVDVANIYNRWNGNFVIAEDGSAEKDSLNWELAWNTPAMAKKYEFDIPDVKAKFIKYADKAYIFNAIKDANDVRIGQDKLQVQPEEQIVIKFDVDDYPFVDRYYVQFDKDNAIESAPSEFESWLSYNATGLFTMKKASERLILTVPADASEGDIIGFRLYAVNYDGTLVDPDGKAFYVQVGFVPNAKESDILAGTFTARYANKYTDATSVVKDEGNSTIIAFDILDNFKLAKGTTLNNAGFVGEVDVKTTTGDNAARLSANTKVKIYYLTSNELKSGKAQSVTDGLIDKVKYLGLEIKNPENVVDDATIETEPLKIVDHDKHDKVIGYISFMLTKGEIKQVTNAQVANNDDKIKYKSGQDGTFYPWYDFGTWNALINAPVTGYAFNLTSYVTGLDAYDDLTTYNWTLDVSNYTTAQNTAWTTAGFGGTPAKATLSPLDTDADDVADQFILNVPSGMVQAGKTATLTISDVAAGDGLSRVANAGIDEIEDASTETHLVAADAHKYQTLTFTFKDVAEQQVYDWSITYLDGTVGAKVATKAPKPATLFAKYSAATIKLANAWKNATDDGTDITAVAVKDYSGAAALALNAIYAKSKNSAYEPFWNGNNWKVTNYVKFAQEEYPVGSGTMIDCIYVKSENGAHNEYITPAVALNTFGNLATTGITFTKTGTTPLLTTINQTLVIKVYDAFGRVQDFSIPFELIP